MDFPEGSYTKAPGDFGNPFGAFLVPANKTDFLIGFALPFGSKKKGEINEKGLDYLFGNYS